MTTSLNLALRLVEKFAGTQIAAATGKMMLIDTNRVSQSSYASLPERNSHSDALVARAQRWMEKSLAQGFSLAELARHLAVSERTLNRRFKRATGEAPLHYLQSLRVDVAKRLLENKGLNVDAVSARVGYSDLSTFRRLFRRETGLSPREYQCRFSRPSKQRGGTAARAARQRMSDFASIDGDIATVGGGAAAIDLLSITPRTRERGVPTRKGVCHADDRRDHSRRGFEA